MERVAELNPKYLLYSDNYIDFDKKMLIKKTKNSEYLKTKGKNVFFMLNYD